MIAERRRGHRVALYCVNQWRTKIGVMRGDPRVLPGGVAQNYWAAIKIEFKNKEEAGRDEAGHHQIDYNEHAFNIKKNKVGVAAREGNFTMVRNPEHPLGQGFVDDARDVVTWAKSVGVVTGGGSSWRIDGKDTKYSRLQDIADMFYDDREFFEHTKQRMIEDYRESKGLERGYL
jgi:RecA/RadA recombinase